MKNNNLRNHVRNDTLILGINSSFLGNYFTPLSPMKEHFSVFFTTANVNEISLKTNRTEVRSFIRILAPQFFVYESHHVVWSSARKLVQLAFDNLEYVQDKVRNLNNQDLLCLAQCLLEWCVVVRAGFLAPFCYLNFKFQRNPRAGVGHGK